jgi:myo-inositol catabolism protein IolC
MIEVISHYQSAGVEADIWKIEGIDSRDDCRRLADQARAGGRDGVGCVVLGRGASQDKVDHWLRQGAGLPGYIGFAIGRTIWSKALTAFRAGEIDRSTAADQIAANYKHAIDVYETAARAT